MTNTDEARGGEEGNLAHLDSKARRFLSLLKDDIETRIEELQLALKDLDKGRLDEYYEDGGIPTETKLKYRLDKAHAAKYKAADARDAAAQTEDIT